MSHSSVASIRRSSSTKDRLNHLRTVLDELGLHIESASMEPSLMNEQWLSVLKKKFTEAHHAQTRLTIDVLWLSCHQEPEADRDLSS
jgi:hypothetical protein